MLHPRFDAVILATGASTPALLRDLGLDAGGFRTKAVQYAGHRSTGSRPTAFLDALSGLYGRPADGGRFLLGLPTDCWDVAPSGGGFREDLAAAAVAVAAELVPGLRLGGRVAAVCAADCYHPEGHLSLRAVPSTTLRLHTFTGGSGGAAKTVLAASIRAVQQLKHRDRGVRTGSSKPTLEGPP
jgi:glycine/D-amino acid oxidase-like deaminating enzyme